MKTCSGQNNSESASVHCACTDANCQEIAQKYHPQSV